MRARSFGIPSAALFLAFAGRTAPATANDASDLAKNVQPAINFNLPDAWAIGHARRRK